MSHLFIEEDDVLDEPFHEGKIRLNSNETTIIDARRRLEKLLDEKLLQKELDDFMDY